MNRLLIFFVFLLPLPAGADGTSGGGDEAARLGALLEREWQWRLRDLPPMATYYGDSRYNDRWMDLSPAAVAGRRAHHRELDAALQAIDRARLPAAARLDYDLIKHDNDAALAGDRFPEEYLLINQMSDEFDSPYSGLADVAQTTPFRTVKDYRDFLERMRRFPAFVAQHRALLERGLAAGITPPRLVASQVPPLIANQLAARAEDTPVYRTVFNDMAPALDALTRESLRAEARALLADAVLPALRELHAYYRDIYVPRARESLAMRALPDGAAWYGARARLHTTTTLTPDEIHQLGLGEVERIRGEMERVKREAGFGGDLGAFIRFLRSDKRFFYTDKNALLAGYRDIAKRIDPELPKLFRTLPRLTYGVFPMAAYVEKTQPAAYYFPGANEVGRSGRFYVNTYDLAARPRWEMESLTLHEAVPGHHLQFMIGQELTGVPTFRRYQYVTAFSEGWGLYAESLGADLGLYRDPYSKFGQLSFEMWRAIRLVVDTGIHWKGWTRAQAIQLFLDNTGKSRHDIEVEVDRYIAWPGQALSYKIGELRIRELRAEATRALGERFSLRDFHDVVLGAGSIPLDVLTARVRAWVAQQPHSSSEQRP